MSNLPFIRDYNITGKVGKGANASLQEILLLSNFQDRLHTAYCMNVCTKGKLKTRFNVHILSETPTSAMSCLILRSELSFTFSINKVWKINRN